jgi:hypothetical protein
MQKAPYFNLDRAVPDRPYYSMQRQNGGEIISTVAKIHPLMLTF